MRRRAFLLSCVLAVAVLRSFLILASRGQMPKASSLERVQDLSEGSRAEDCKGDGDLAVIARRKDDLRGDVQACALRCFLSGEDCMLGCVEGIGFTTGCASCWVNLASCSQQRCILHCLVPNSGTCAQCAYERCFPGLLSCSGLPRERLPKGV